jgi:glycerophosphoryl diester phosphodiesterase
MDAGDATATTVEGYVGGGVAEYRTELYAGCGTLMTHKESIEL